MTRHEPCSLQLWQLDQTQNPAERSTSRTKTRLDSQVLYLYLPYTRPTRVQAHTLSPRCEYVHDTFAAWVLMCAVRAMRVVSVGARHARTRSLPHVHHGCSRDHALAIHGSPSPPPARLFAPSCSAAVAAAAAAAAAARACQLLTHRRRPLASSAQSRCARPASHPRPIARRPAAAAAAAAAACSFSWRGAIARGS